jgi:hypothetical protein
MGLKKYLNMDLIDLYTGWWFGTWLDDMTFHSVGNGIYNDPN